VLIGSLTRDPESKAFEIAIVPNPIERRLFLTWQFCDGFGSNNARGGQAVSVVDWAFKVGGLAPGPKLPPHLLACRICARHKRRRAPLLPLFHVPRKILCQMSKLDYRNIEKVPGRCGGRAVVASTRIRVSVILTCYRQGMTVEEILQEYPHLKAADVHDALAYAYEHPDEIEADFAADDEDTVQREHSAPDAG